MINLGFLPSLSLGYLFSTIFKNDKGILFGLKEAFAYVYVSIVNSGTKPRLYEYDVNAPSDNLEKLAISVPKQEFKLDYRRHLSKEHKESESSLFYGENSSGSRLLVQITRRFDGLSSLWLNLKLDTGEEYSLPKTQFFVEPKTGAENFVCGGLRMKCLQPMRRWRISYNGLLKNTAHKADKTVHVKFGFIYVTSSEPYDVSSTINPKTVAHFLAQGLNWEDAINELRSTVDRYVQVGNFYGQVQIPEDGVEDREMLLWGARRRHQDKGPTASRPSITEYICYFKSGECIYFGELGLSCRSTRLPYAFIMQSNSIGGSAREASIQQSATLNDIITVKRGPFTRNCFLKKTYENMRLANGDASSTATDVSFVQAILDGDEPGYGIILKNHGAIEDNLPKPRIKLPPLGKPQMTNLVVSLIDPCCRLSEVSGGKGSSLAELTKLATEINSGSKFAVPRGVVVTTTAYETHINESKLNDIIGPLEKLAGEMPSLLQERCQTVVNEFQSRPIPESIKDEIRDQLRNTFGETFTELKFAVRSSASGEDSEELSAAGQMTTYLGVQGTEQIFNDVSKCWASQFSFVAVQYKRQNGQVLNSPMAVVIQEMIPADVAGVMFTCDPVTGNPTQLTITANYGIGESVVSAAAEPDTIIMERNESGLTGISRVNVGKKSLQIVLAEDGGVKEESVTEDLSSRSSLPINQAKMLAEIGILVEESYGCPIDIEFGFLDENLYLLQARPITTFDKESEFELAHEHDSPLRAENEYSTTGNVGEVMPGASTYLGNSTIMKFIQLTMVWLMKSRGKYNVFINPYFMRGMLRSQNHAMMSIMDSALRFYHGKDNFITQSQGVSLFGRLIDDKEMLKIAAKRNKFYPPSSALVQSAYIIGDMLFSNSKLRKVRKSIWDSKIDISKSNDIQQKYYDIWHQFLEIGEDSVVHIQCTMTSSFYNIFLLSILVSGNKGWGPKVYKDFAYILSSCYDVESVDVPNAIERLAGSIAKCTNASTFKEMTGEEALKWLQSTGSAAGKEFKLFLENHGHRCYQEFDIFAKPWYENPLALIKTLQEMACVVAKKGQKKPLGTSETIKNLTVTLNWKQKLLLRFAIPLCRHAVGMRERSKSLIIKVTDHVRKAFRKLGKELVRKGRVPEEDLIYYLDFDELEQLILTRSPTLLQKAIRRRAIFKGMDKLIFPEISTGFPKPINYEKKVVSVGSLVMKGTPASNGVAEGLARVATSLEEAANIQPGEILIAYSTDIGWSPFFPMLAGVATELGGLVSHGAVVAREYGLPCVVSVQSATMHFQTGDRVRLNGNKGTLERLDV